MISLRLKNKDFYALKILPGNPKWLDDRGNVSDLPVSNGIWKKVGKEDVFDHYEVPRVDVGQILQRWDKEEIEASPQVLKDFRTYKFVMRPLESLVRIPYSTRDLYPDQANFTTIAASRNRIGCTFGTGDGKCLKFGTLVLKFNGALIRVENLKVGDRLMGPDSQPRTITSLARGREMMYEIVPVKGKPFGCNESHILTMKKSGNSYKKNDHGTVVNMSVKDYLCQNPTLQTELKLYRSTTIQFPPAKPLPVDPYFLGLWLGDGHKCELAISKGNEPEIIKEIYQQAKNWNVAVRIGQQKPNCATYYLTNGCTYPKGNALFAAFKSLGLFNNKHIPKIYRTASESDRLQLLAGLIDTDGFRDGSVIEITQKRKILAKHILFLCRSLGLAAYNKPSVKGCMYKGEMRSAVYQRIIISGDTDRIPIRVERKKCSPRRQKKSVLVTGFKVKQVGVGDYYGFTLDGPDRRFLLGDFTVAHNTRASLKRVDALRHRRLLVISLGSIVDDWQREVAGCYGCEMLLYVGTPTQRSILRERIKLTKPRVVWCTYDLAHELAEGAEFDHVIFDEAHIIANSETKKAKLLQETIIAYTWRKKGCGVTALTATPYGNLPVDMWNIFRLIHPFIAGSKRGFELSYQHIDETAKVNFRYKNSAGDVRTGSRTVAKKISVQNIKKLQKLLAAAVVQNTTEEKPSYIDDIQTIEVGMTDAQKSAYFELATELSTVIGTEKIKIHQLFDKFVKLVQVGEGLYHFDMNQWKESGKLIWCVREIRRLIKAGKGEKIIIWSPFVAGLELLHEIFKNESVLYIGDLNKSQKKLAKWSFNGIQEGEYAEFSTLRARYNGRHDPGKAQVFLSTISGNSSIGMNLQACGYQVFMSPHLSGYAMPQTRGRICRKNTKHKVIKTRYLLIENSWEPALLIHVMSKYENAQAVLKGSKSAAFSRDQAILYLKLIRRSIASM